MGRNTLNLAYPTRKIHNTLREHTLIPPSFTTPDRRKNRTARHTFTTAGARLIIHFRRVETLLRYGTRRADANGRAGMILRTQFFSDYNHNDPLLIIGLPAKIRKPGNNFR